MIVVQTPLRVSLLGGGTDLADFYTHESGCVVSTAIDKYIFVIIKQRFDTKIRLGYTRIELVDSVDEIRHELAREALRKTGITQGVEIATLGDIPSEGSGLGSSSTVTVGLLNAMHAYQGKAMDAETLARQACEIEIERLGKPIGKQDQYIAAYGGLRFITFHPDGSVEVEPLPVDESVKRQLSNSLMLFFTNVTRKAETVLTEQKANTSSRLAQLQELKALALKAKACILAGELDELGRLLHLGWECKKQLASKITNDSIDEIYAAARRAGAIGGKITGAGGGGFLLLYCPPERQEKVRQALKPLPELPFRLEPDGSKIILNYRR